MGHSNSTGRSRRDFLGAVGVGVPALLGTATPTAGRTAGPVLHHDVSWQPGEDEIAVTVTVENAPGSGTIRLNPLHRVIEATGVRNVGGRLYESTDGLGSAELRLAVSAPRGRSRTEIGTIERGDGWVLTFRSLLEAEADDFGANSTVSVVSPGRVSPFITVLLGEIEEVRRESAVGEVRAIAPRAARVDLGHACEVLVRGSEAFQAGDMPERMLGVFVPSGGGSSPTKADRDYGEVIFRSSREQTLLHELVHLNQRGGPGGDAAWMIEGTADYFGALLAKDLGYWSTGEFYEFVSTREDADARLSEPGMHVYTKGRRVCAALDAEIRTHTKHGGTLQEVFAEMFATSAVPADVSQPDRLHRAVARAADADLDDWLTRYTTTTAAPTVPWSPELTLAPWGSDSDADGDGFTRAEELERGTNSIQADTDVDGLPDDVELGGETKPTVADTDEDRLFDGAEVNEHGTDPLAADTDGDGVRDGHEVSRYDTDPLATDTDGDGIEDFIEIREGMDPRSRASWFQSVIVAIKRVLGLV